MVAGTMKAFCQKRVEGANLNTAQMLELCRHFGKGVCRNMTRSTGGRFQRAVSLVF